MIFWVSKLIKRHLKSACRQSKTIEDIFYGTSSSCTKKLLTFAYGLLAGLIFYYSIIRFIGFSREHKALALLITCLSSAFLCLASIQFRCLTFLMWLFALGRAGRSLIKTLIIALVLSGPIHHIVANTKEVTRVFECTAYLTYNLTKTKIDLAITPFINAFSEMESNFSAVQASFNEIEEAVVPIVQEIEYANDSYSKRPIRNANLKSPEEYTKLYSEKLKSRCEMQLRKGTINCQKSFQRVYNDCVAKATALICLPLKIDYICNLNDVTSTLVVDLCDPSNVIDADFGNEYAHLRAEEGNFTSEYSNIKFDVQTKNIKELQSVKALNATGIELSKKLSEKADLIDYIFHLCDKLMALIYLKVIYDSIRYHDNYLSRINFHNYYVTDYFKRIDERRARGGRKCVLPIRIVDDGKLIDSDGSKKLRREFQGYVGLTLRLFLHILAVSFFVVLDRLYYELLDIIRRHSRINFEQEGYHFMNVTVNGTGFAADLIRRSVNGFNVNKNVDYIMTNEMCLPRPILTETVVVAQIYILFILNLYLIYNQVHIHRFKRVVCAYFYPKREKRRIRHLYNKILTERKRIFNAMLQTAKCRTPKQHKWLQSLMRTCKCLRVFSFARPKCVICHKTQARECSEGDFDPFWMCKRRKCNVTLCNQCWMDCGQKCIFCLVRRTEAKP